MRGPIRYQKELQKAYIIMAQCKKEMIEGYCGQMLLRGRLKGLAECETHLIDGQRELWYDISSLQTLEQIFAVRELSYRELEGLLRQLIMIIREMEQYLLDGRQLCLEPEYIYQDMESRQVRLLFDCTGENEKSSIGRLAEFILERTDHTDEKAVELAYFFYECATKDSFSVKELERFLEEMGGSVKAAASESGGQPRQEAADGKRERQPWQEAESGKWEKQPRQDVESGKQEKQLRQEAESGKREKQPRQEAESGKREKQPRQDVESGEWERRPQHKAETNALSGQPRQRFSWESKNGKRMEMGLALAITALLCGVAFFIVKRYYILENQEESVWIAASLLAFAAGMALFLYALVIERRAEKPETDGYKKDRKEPKNRKEQKERKGYKNRKNKEAEKQPGDIWTEEGDYEWEAEMWRQQEEQQSDFGGMDGKTVYIGQELFHKEYILEEAGKGGGQEYPISSYPFLIGKDKERVNLTVKNRSVSRIHARLTQEEGAVYLEDLHSTNGTCLNDLPMQPHDRIRLKRGDMLRFGTAEFILR